MSTGELSIALAFVKGQNIGKYNYTFIIPKEKQIIIDDNSINVYTLSTKNSCMENQAIISDIIDKVSPELIILFDAFTFEYAQNWTGYNLDLLHKKNIPIASLDEYEYTRTNYKLDYYGIFVKRLPDLLSQCNYVLKNCPLSMPSEEHTDKHYYYRALPELYTMKEQERNVARKEILGEARKNAKVVFFATSAWEVEGAYSFACQNELSRWLGPILFNYLNDISSNIVLLHVGKENWNIVSNERVTYIHRDNLSTSEFEKSIQIADLFVTYNIVSISLSKAIMFNIPAIVFNNKKIIEFEKLWNVLRERPSWYQNMANEVKKVYPFSASLFGWSNFLKACLAQNEYAETFEVANVFNYNETKTLLQRILFDEQSRKCLVERQRCFMTKYKQIGTAESVLDMIFAEH